MTDPTPGEMWMIVPFKDDYGYLVEEFTWLISGGAEDKRLSIGDTFIITGRPDSRSYVTVILDNGFTSHFDKSWIRDRCRRIG